MVSLTNTFFGEGSGVGTNALVKKKIKPIDVISDQNIHMLQH